MKAVLGLADCNLSGDPEGAPKPRIAKLRQLRLASELTGLIGCEIETAELQELSMMAKAAEIAGLREHGQRSDRSDARDLPEALVIRIGCQYHMSLLFDQVALADQASSLGDDDAEHADRRAVERNRQADRGCCGLVNIAQQPGLRDLLVDHAPSRFDERVL